MKTRLLTSLSCLVFLAVELLCVSARGTAIYLNPVAEDGLRQWAGSQPFVLGWGYGDVFNQSDAIDETIIDFKLSGIPQGTQISSATLSFFMQTQSPGASQQPLNVFTFYGESMIQPTDWNAGTFFGSFGDVYGLQSWDLTAAVQSAINGGQSLLDFRIATTDPNCVAIIDPPWQSPRLSLQLVEVPEPKTPTLLACAIGLTLLFYRRRVAARSSMRLLVAHK